jgi:hypothetical protein
MTEFVAVNTLEEGGYLSLNFFLRTGFGNVSKFWLVLAGYYPQNDHLTFAVRTFRNAFVDRNTSIKKAL